LVSSDFKRFVILQVCFLNATDVNIVGKKQHKCQGD
jgi:hypothetical protein